MYACMRLTNMYILTAQMYLSVLITYTLYSYIYIFMFTVQEMTEDDWEAAEQLMKCEQDCLAEWGL